ncbi:MAG TPA: Ig-like domain-containing protein [Patescibacteria group bacterium]|nr:Ig-like domain-containing protein [Patescibacteria group bacterium]
MQKKKNLNLKLVFLPVLLVMLILILLPAFVKVIKVTKQVSHYTISFQNPLDFTYDVTKISLDNSGAKLINGNYQADIILLKPLEIPNNSRILGFKENVQKLNGTKISYQVTTDNQHWYYYDGAKWRMAGGNCGDCTNNIVELNKNINQLPVSSGNFQIKVYLASISADIPVLHSIDLTVQGREAKDVDQEEKTVYVFQNSFAKNLCGNGSIDPGEQCDDGNNSNTDFCSNQCENQTPICHATGSVKNPYDFMWANDSEINGGGVNDHSQHPGDIIPITDVNGDGTIDLNDCTAIPPVNLPPLANNDAANTNQDDPVVIDVLSNDSDPDGTLVISSVAVTLPPTNGSITSIDLLTGKITYTPSSGFSGTDTFQYKVCDNGGLCSTATVTVDIAADLPPIANADSVSTNMDVSVDVDVLANDSDPDGTLVPASVVVTVNPTNGTITGIDPLTGKTTYKPNLGYSGTDTFVYKVCDNDASCATATVTVNISQTPPKPVCGNGVVETGEQCDDGNKKNNDFCSNQCENQTPICHATGSVKNPYDFMWANDSEINGGGVNDHSQHPGDIIPITDRNGDGDINVDDCSAPIPANLPPTVLDDSASTTQDVPVVIDILANDSDSDGTIVPSTVTITVNPTNGTITSIDPVTGKVIYTPNTGYYGSDSFQYQVCDDDGACDTATVTVLVLAPPLAVDDSASTNFNNSVIIDVLSNDSDPDGTLNPSTVIVTTSPNNGTVSIDPVTGKITYTPNTGYYGSDSFQYQVCDNDGLCNTATVAVTINYPSPSSYTYSGTSGTIVTPPVPPPTPVVSPVVIEPIAPPLVVPPIIAPPPPPTPMVKNIGVSPEFCGGRVYTTPDVLFVGFISNPPSTVAQTQYSLDNGANWITTLNVPPFDSTGGLFNFTALGLENGTYTVSVRMVDIRGDITTSIPCDFSVASGELVFGANQFVKSDAYSPVSANGVIQFAMGEPQTIYLEAKAATSAYIEATAVPSFVNTGKTKISSSDTQRFNLVYDEGLELWKGNISFSSNGAYSLTGFVANSLTTYSREINTAYVSSAAKVTDKSTGKPVAGAKTTVYVKNIDNDRFIIWNGSSYGQSNPSQTDENGSINLFLPRGDYYLEIKKDGYNSATSLITTISEYSSVNTSVQMSSSGSLIDQLFNSDNTTNFPLIITPLPEVSLLKNGQDLPDIELTDSNGSGFNLFSKLDKKTTIIMVYNSWNTLAQEQLGIFEALKKQLGDQYQYFPISTLEPTETSRSYIGRGDYGLEIYKPSKKFFDDYSIISLPNFIILDENNKFIGSIVGPYSVTELVKMINDIDKT